MNLVEQFFRDFVDALTPPDGRAVGQSGVELNAIFALVLIIALATASAVWMR